MNHLKRGLRQVNTGFILVLTQLVKSVDTYLSKQVYK